MILDNKGIGQQIIKVRFTISIFHLDHACIPIFSHPMIGNIILLVLGGSKGNGSTDYHALIV